LKREKKMSREGKIKKKVWVWKRKKEKNRKVKKEKYICMREWKKKKRKRKEEWQERYERDESSERKTKCKEGCHVVERRNIHSFSNHVQSDNEDVIGASQSYFLLPLHKSTILNLLILDIPTYGLILMIIGFERVNNH
jgi:hypothetical protein